MSEKVKDELEHFKKRIEAAIIGEYEWFVSWSAENIETDLKEHFETQKLHLDNEIKGCREENEALKIKVEEMQKALEWYADPKNYRHVESAAYSDVALDEGETARDALKGVETN